MPAAKMSHNGALASIRGKAVSCADPAYTIKVIRVAILSLKPDLTIAIPVTNPQVPTAMNDAIASVNPYMNARRCALFSRQRTSDLCFMSQYLYCCILQTCLERYCNSQCLVQSAIYFQEIIMSMSDRDGFIWYDGKLVPWRDANTHVLTHSLHYGLAIFEGLRAYETELGTAIFRLHDHTNRLFNSAHI